MNTVTTVDLDVLVIGAGISGIGLGYYLKRDCPHKTFAILEARDSIGGTWDLFRYPGIRSDSDLHTFGYEFKPWTHEKSIADAHLILDYIRETAREFGIDQHIRFGHKVLASNWSSTEQRWLVDVRCADGATKTMRAKWLFCAAGYYKYEEGFSPEFKGLADFKGQVVHPQHWPENLDYTGKKVVVIGSGATAVTLIPAMADKTAHITMLQRTPTYIMSLPAKDPLAELFKKWLPEKMAYHWVRRKNITLQRLFWLYCQKFPNAARKYIRKHVAKRLPEGFDIDKHFNPPYNPWDQRLCAVPNGDLFRTIRQGKASVVTDHIDHFVADGIQLKSGEKLPADLVITATGLNIQLMGGVQMSVDGKALSPGNHVAYKGMMMNDVPNFVFAIGYTNSSWTLKVGLLCEHFCRLLNHMDETGQAVCTPRLPKDGMETRPILDFGAGYIQRALPTLPKQGVRRPWVMNMNYFFDEKVLRHGPVADEGLSFEGHKA
ncbi:MAG TPA: NAD(P)/FAD-dependent oxidoreductase [Limnobacter sp.]|uniref:flavin-containing monooxygenase n=1 Tax=Limnobacter sp. TaxID=2003368 RepID=UPI002ED8858A